MGPGGTGQPRGQPTLSYHMSQGSPEKRNPQDVCVCVQGSRRPKEQPVSSSKSGGRLQAEFPLSWGSVSVLFRLSPDWPKPTHVMGGNLLYSVSTDVNITLTPEHPHRHTQSDVWPRQCHTQSHTVCCHIPGARKAWLGAAPPEQARGQRTHVAPLTSGSEGTGPLPGAQGHLCSCLSSPGP